MNPPMLSPLQDRATPVIAAIGGAVVSGPGLRYVGLVGALFSLVAAGFVLLTLLIDRKVR